MVQKNPYAWSAINRFGVQLIGFVGNVLVARLLNPDDYGLVAMLAIVMGISWNFTESGFSDCLIRERNVDKKHYSTVFVYNVFVSLIIYVVLYFAAPLIADFFNRIELVNITRVLSISIVINSVTLTEFTRMRREMLFKKIALIQVCTSLIGVSISYTMALWGYGYWALIGLTLSISIINLVMIIILNRWIPSIYFSWSRYNSMRTFSNDMLVSYLTNQAGHNLFSVIIGKFYSSATLGFYSQATKIKDATLEGINAVILTTSYPLIAKEQDLQKRKQLYVMLLNHFLFIQFTLALFLIGSAESLIGLVFGTQWLPAAPMLQLILVVFLFFPVKTVNQNIIKIEGKTGLYRNLTMLKNVLNIFALIICSPFSIEAILIGQIIATYLSVAIDVTLCGKHISFYPKEQFSIILKQLFSPVAACIMAFIISMSITNSISQLISFTVAYFLILFVLNSLFKNISQAYFVKLCQSYL